MVKRFLDLYRWKWQQEERMCLAHSLLVALALWHDISSFDCATVLSLLHALTSAFGLKVRKTCRSVGILWHRPSLTGPPVVSLPYLDVEGALAHDFCGDTTSYLLCSVSDRVVWLDFVCSHDFFGCVYSANRRVVRSAALRHRVSTVSLSCTVEQPSMTELCYVTQTNLFLFSLESPVS